MEYKQNYSKEKIKRCQQAFIDLEKDLEREPLPQEIATETGIDLWEVRDLMTYQLENMSPEKDDFQLRFSMTIKNHTLEKARLAKGLTQAEFGKQIGINMPTYCTIECCRKYPTDREQELISNALGISKAMLFPEWLRIYSERWKNARKSQIVPMHMVALSDRDALALPSGSEDDMKRQAENSILKNVIGSALGLLTKKEKEILSLRFLDERTLEDVAMRMGVSRERIRQVEAKALEKLREDPTIQALNETQG